MIINQKHKRMKMMECNNSTGDELEKERIFQKNCKDSIKMIKKKKTIRHVKVDQILKEQEGNKNHKKTYLGHIEEKMNKLFIDDKEHCTEQLHKFYYNQEIIKLFNQYGTNVYSYSKSLEEETQITVNPLLKHNISPGIRTKMIDWMLEVFYAYQCDPPSFFLAVDLLDHYFSSANETLNDNDVHLIGIVCIFIASKMEDLIPLRMSHIKVKIGHNKFIESDIKKKEKMILEATKFNVIHVSTYDFIRTLLCDLTINNNETIELLKMKCHIDSFENVSVFLGKLLTLDNEFIIYSYSLKAICCVIVAFDIIRSNSKTFTQEMEVFIRQWLLFVIEESQFASDLVSLVYQKLICLYHNMERNKSNFNLSKTHSFIFY